MSKKGRKQVLQVAAKAIYKRKAGKKASNRARPGRPDGGASAVANVIKKISKSSLQSSSGKRPKAVANGAVPGKDPSLHSIPFSPEDTILLVGEGESWPWAKVTVGRM